MAGVEMLGLAGSLSLLAGWRLYLCVFAAGLAMRMGWIAAPDHLQWLGTMQNPWVMAAALTGFVAELFADKVAWLDSAWDAVHTAIRPLGGALLALAIVDPQDPAWQLIAFLLGGGAAFLGHSAKTSARAMVNLSPEPFSNVVVSTGEDVTTGALVFAALTHPLVAWFVFVAALVGTLALLVLVRRLIRRLGVRLRKRPGQKTRSGYRLPSSA
jgi:hypothetical protein